MKTISFLQDVEKIYFIGINGIGMSGIAKILNIKGYQIEGADISRNYITEELEKLNIKVHQEHLAENIEKMDLIVTSSAINENNPELLNAKKLGKKIIKRGELLSLLMNEKKGIAVAGTHGKTTTSSMLTSVLLDIEPTAVIGGILPEINSNAKNGKSELFIVEADESDNSFLYLKPKISIITNIEADHLENHGNIENIKKSFTKFMNQTTEEILICGDCKETLNLVKNKKKVKQYSIEDKKAHIYAKNIRIESQSTLFDVVIDEEEFGEYKLLIPGKHNIQNALPVIYLGKKYGITKERIREKLSKFKGAKRRYDILYDEKIRIIDDYAHHPTEIKATIQGVKSIEKNEVTIIFQPHRYSRVNFLLNEFKDSFEGADKLILMPIYSAGEENESGITLEKLKETIDHKNCIIVEENKKIEEEINSEKEKRTFLFMGAGNISNLAHSIAKNMGEK